MPQIIEIIFRTIAAFFILMVVARILGKITISQMTYFDFVAAITMGAITANLAFNHSLNIFDPLVSIVTFAAVTFFIAYISLKSQKARKIFAGDPTVVIQNGKILENNMRKMRYTLDYLNQELREKNVFNIEEVLFAILEVNGTLTILKKPQYRQVTRQDLWIAANPEWRLAIELIMDGKIIDKNLRENHIAFSWLDKKLNERNLRVSDVLYAVLGGNGDIYFDTYDDQIKSPVDQE